MDAFDEYSDYFEAVVLTCRFPGCSWQHDIDWSDLEVVDGGSEARRLFSQHFTSAHPDVH